MIMALMLTAHTSFALHMYIYIFMGFVYLRFRHLFQFVAKLQDLWARLTGTRALADELWTRQVRRITGGWGVVVVVGDGAGYA